MPTIVKGPYLQHPTVNSMTVMWETSEPATSQVDIYLAERIHSGHQGNYKMPQQLLSTYSCHTYTTIHQITIDNLEPSTIYFYRIKSENAEGSVESGRYPLKTAVPKGEPFSFTVTSETGGFSGFDRSNGRINQNIFQQMQRYRPDLTLFIGDIVNDGHRYEDWETYFFGPGQSFLLSTPFYSCLGNHESNASWYYDFFAFPAPKNCYSFDYGDVHFTCLDSTSFIKPNNYPHADEEIYAGDQVDFLLKDLETADAAWKIVYFHYPPYVSGGYQVEDLRKLSPIFEQYGVDLVFNSHTIVYERSHPLRDDHIDENHGVVYVVAGGAGAMPEWLLPKREWHTAQSLAVPHFIQVVVTPDRLSLYAIDEEGKLFDTLIVKKGQDGHKAFF